jgi:hypothetical protein
MLAGKVAIDERVRKAGEAHKTRFSCMHRPEIIKEVRIALRIENIFEHRRPGLALRMTVWILKVSL